MEHNGYQLSRAWFDFCFENPEKINPNHTAIFMFAIEHCNRLGWKEKFGFPSQMTMDAIGIKNHHTYIKYFNDLVNWGFLKLIQKSTNQYSANVISLNIGMSKNSKALDKAFIKHASKQPTKHVPSNPQSNDSIDKPLTINHKPSNNLKGDELLNDWVYWGDKVVKGEDQFWEALRARKVSQQEMDAFLSVAVRNGWNDMDTQAKFRQSLKGFDYMKFNNGTNGQKEPEKIVYKPGRRLGEGE